MERERARPSEAEPSRAEPSRAEPRHAAWSSTPARTVPDAVPACAGRVARPRRRAGGTPAPSRSGAPQEGRRMLDLDRFVDGCRAALAALEAPLDAATSSRCSRTGAYRSNASPNRRSKRWRWPTGWRDPRSAGTCRGRADRPSPRFRNPTLDMQPKNEVVVHPRGRIAGRRDGKTEQVAGACLGTPRGRGLFGHRLARPARVGGEVPQLGEPVPDRQHGFGVVQVDGRLERDGGELGGVDIVEP